MPGPGVYAIPSKIGEGTKFTMGARTNHDSIFIKSEVPGPGTYRPVNVTHTSAKFSMKGKHKIGTQIVITPDGGHEKMTESNADNVPGPGTYSAITTQIYTNLSTKFGTEVRTSMSIKGADKIPAPNAYSRDAKSVVMRSAPSFGFGG